MKFRVWVTVPATMSVELVIEADTLDAAENIALDRAEAGELKYSLDDCTDGEAYVSSSDEL